MHFSSSTTNVVHFTLMLVYTYIRRNPSTIITKPRNILFARTPTPPLPAITFILKHVVHYTKPLTILHSIYTPPPPIYLNQSILYILQKTISTSFILSLHLLKPIFEKLSTLTVKTSSAPYNPRLHSEMQFCFVTFERTDEQLLGGFEHFFLLIYNYLI